MSHDIGGLIKWASSIGWRDRFDELIDWHLGAADEFGLDMERLYNLLGDRMLDLEHCAFEDLAATIFEDGSNLVDDYIKRRGWKEGASTRAYMQAMRDSLMSIYEVSNIIPGASFMARDLVRGGEPILVAERTATQQMKPWDRLAARLVTVNGKTMMTGAVLMFVPAAVEHALNDIAIVRGKLEADEPHGTPELDEALIAHVLRTGAALLSSAWLRAVLERLVGDQQPRITDIDGNLLETIYVSYDLKRGVSQAKVRAAIDAIPGVRAVGRKFWTWVVGEEPQPRIKANQESDQPGSVSLAALLDPENSLAEIEIVGRSLYIDVDSRAVAEDVIARLSVPLSGLVGEPSIEVEPTDLDDADMDDIELPEVTEVMLQGYMRQHYLKALDEPVPMLGGKIPRTAIKTEAGRRQVADWLKYLENAHATNRDISVAYDPCWLWDELDLRSYRK